MRKINENTLEVVKNKVIIKKNPHPTKFMWMPKQWRFIVTWHKQNTCRGLRRLHIIVRLPFLHIIRNNGFTEIGDRLQLTIFNTL